MKIKSCLSTVMGKIKNFFNNLTIEPILFFLGIIKSLDKSAINKQLIIDKICLNEYGFSPEFCHQLGDKGMRRRNEFLSGNNTLIQNEAAQFGVYASVIDHLIPVIVAIFLGAWSDRFGRKFLLYIFFFFAIIDACGDLLNSYFMEWPKEFLLLTSNLPVALSGGRIVMKIGITSFVSDITDPKDRTTRLATFAFMGSLGRPIGIQVGAYLWEVGGYLAIFGTKIAGLTLTLVMLAIRLECFKWETKEMEVEREKSKREHQSGRGLGGRRHMLSILHFKDTVKTFFKKRAYGLSFFLFIYTAIYFIDQLTIERSIFYNIVRTRYGWSIREVSNYKTISISVEIIGQALLIPLLGWLALPDANIICFILFTILSGNVITGFAVESWMLYIGNGVDLLKRYYNSAIKSSISKCVDFNEKGKVMALIFTIESFFPIFMSQLYATVWKAIDTPELRETLWIGGTSFLSAGISVFAFLLSLIAWRRLRGRDIDDIGKKEIEPLRMDSLDNCLEGKNEKEG